MNETDKRAIEEMASDIAQSGMLDSLSRCRIVAEELYFKGYSKQSENVVELPCKVGDMLYKPYCGKILEYKVTSFSFRVEGLLAHTQSKQTGGLHPVWCASIGKTYFIHRHEAEAVQGRMWQT